MGFSRGPTLTEGSRGLAGTDVQNHEVDLLRRPSTGLFATVGSCHDATSGILHALNQQRRTWSRATDHGVRMNLSMARSANVLISADQAAS